MKYNPIPSYFHHYHILSNIILFTIAHPGSRIPERLIITWLVKKFSHHIEFMIHFHVHKNIPLVPIQSCTNLVHTLTPV
jgi:hypothetical protein